MLNTEFNLEDAKLIWKQEAFEDGFENGFKGGVKQGKIEGMVTKQIEMLKRFNVDEVKIIEEIKRDYGLSEEEIKRYL